MSFVQKQNSREMHVVLQFFAEPLSEQSARSEQDVLVMNDTGCRVLHLFMLSHLSTACS